MLTDLGSIPYTTTLPTVSCMVFLLFDTFVSDFSFKVFTDATAVFAPAAA